MQLNKYFPSRRRRHQIQNALCTTRRDERKIMMTTSITKEIVECCMCGDRGLSDELVPCRSCSFRFQHRYCSNQYPDAASYETCNWCLLNDDSPKGKNGNTSQALLNSCSSPQKRQSGNSLDRHLKKRNSSGTPRPRQVVVTDGDSMEEKPALRRTRSEEAMPLPMPNKGIRKYGLRNRVVRRYKLLDEVAT